MSQPTKHSIMMQKGQGTRVRITENSVPDKETTGEIRIQSWDKKERTLRALKFGGMCWGAAVIAGFIPLLHFVLVPGLLLAGPIVAFILSGQKNMILGGEGTCPHCRASFPISGSALKERFSDLCSHCRSSLEIEVLS